MIGVLESANFLNRDVQLTLGSHFISDSPKLFLFKLNFLEAFFTYSLLFTRFVGLYAK